MNRTTAPPRSPPSQPPPAKKIATNSTVSGPGTTSSRPATRSTARTTAPPPRGPPSQPVKKIATKSTEPPVRRSTRSTITSSAVGEEKEKGKSVVQTHVTEESDWRHVFEGITIEEDVRTQEDLGMTEFQRGKAEKRTQANKRNYFVHWNEHGKPRKIVFIKVIYGKDFDKAKKEYIINKALEDKVPHIIPPVSPKGYYEGMYNNQKAGFIVLDFIKSVTLSSYISDEGRTNEILLEGFEQMLETCAKVDSSAPDNKIKIEFGDLNGGQILYSKETNKWYLIDFGTVIAHIGGQTYKLTPGSVAGPTAVVDILKGLFQRGMRNKKLPTIPKDTTPARAHRILQELKTGSQHKLD